jgi:hypothetical protein
MPLPEAALLEADWRKSQVLSGFVRGLLCLKIFRYVFEIGKARHSGFVGELVESHL